MSEAEARREKLRQDQLLIQQQLATRRDDYARLERCLRRLLRRPSDSASQKRFRLFAYNLYCSKPRIYKRLKPLLQLPDESSFQNFKLYLSPEFEECILYFLSSKLNSLKPEVNHFVLCVDQHPLNRNYVYDTKRDIVLGLHNVNGMVVNSPASMAYVMMLRNLCIDWVHPVAYAFRCVMLSNYNQITNWCTQVMNKLLEIGIQVEAITFPETFIQAWYSYKGEGNQTNFTFKNTNVCHLHDLRVLIEGVRNCLINNDFYYNESRISWYYIKLLYQLQTDSDLIKEADIQPSGGQGSQWRRARGVFNLEVCAALERLADGGALPHEARPTAGFARAMARLLALARMSAPRPLSEQLTALRRAEDMFANIRLRSGEVPAVVGQTRVALAALATLLQNLASKGFETVHTSRLTNAPVHAFFDGVARSPRSGRRLRPTASQVYTAFAAAFARAMRRRSRWARREELAAAAACGLLDARRVPPAALPPRSPLQLPRALRYRVELPRTKHAEASFLLDGCLRTHACPRLRRALHPRRGLQYEAPPEVPALWGRLLEPPGEFARLVHELREQAPALLKAALPRPGGAALRALSARAGGLGAALCACLPRRPLLALLLRRLLWQGLRQSNRRLREGELMRCGGLSFQQHLRKYHKKRKTRDTS